MMRKFSPRKRISIKFANSEGKSEGAVDMGGPKKESGILSDQKDVNCCFQIHMVHTLL